MTVAAADTPTWLQIGFLARQVAEIKHTVMTLENMRGMVKANSQLKAVTAMKQMDSVHAGGPGSRRFRALTWVIHHCRQARILLAFLHAAWI